MSAEKNVNGLLLLFDPPHQQFTLDEFLALVEDIVSVQIKRGRLEKQHRQREIAFLMTYWHRKSFNSPADVTCITKSSSDATRK